jgi:predicted PurR-regulated permease PerM
MPENHEETRPLRHIRSLLIGIFILFGIAAAYFARDFLLPVVIAFFIALTFRPLIRRLNKLSVPSWFAATVFISGVVMAVLGALYLFLGPIAAWIAQAPAYAHAFSRKLADIRASFDFLARLTERIEAAASPPDGPQPEPAQVVVQDSNPLEYLLPITGYSAGIVTTIVLSLVIAAFLMASGDLFYEKLVKVLPTLSDKKRALRIVYDVETEVSTYLLTVTLINAGLGLAIAASFHLLGMPSPYFWGLLVFVLNFIPYVGAVTGIGLSAFMAVITFDSLAYAALVPLAYAAWNGIENQFVTPLFLGRRLELNAVSILLAIAFWTWLWGIAGTIVAVPILVTVKIFCDHIESLSGLGEFLSERRVEEPEEAGEEVRT